MAKVHHISVSDLRKLKHDALETPYKEKVLEDLHAFGLDEAFIKEMKEDDLEAILEISNNASMRVAEVSPGLPKTINWYALIGLVLGVLVVMILLLDLARPESVRDAEENEPQEVMENNPVTGESVVNDADKQNADPSSDVEEETQLDVASDPVNSETDKTSGDVEDDVQEGGTTEEADNGQQTEPDQAKDNDSPVKTGSVTSTTGNKPKPKKTYISVSSAKVIMEEALNKGKYTPSDIPSFRGGKPGLEKYVKQKVGQIEHDKVDFGYRSVIVSFEVSPKGKVSNVQLMAGLSPELDQQTLEIIKNMPDWTPGKRVKMRYQLAVKYK